jgi:hypothetical protein
MCNTDIKYSLTQSELAKLERYNIYNRYKTSRQSILADVENGCTSSLQLLVYIHH